MIKGINRQVVEVKDTGNDCFEKILFFVKPEYAGISEGKIRERAGQIANGTSAPPPTKLRKSKATEILKLTACLIMGIAVGIVISLMVR